MKQSEWQERDGAKRIDPHIDRINGWLLFAHAPVSLSLSLAFLFYLKSNTLRIPQSALRFSGRELFAVQKPSYTVRGVRQSSSKKKKAVGSVMNLINLFNKDDEG